MVTSLAEVWIEIIRRCRNITDWIVTSLAEVWIEIGKSYVDTAFVIPSLPLRKCGLKYSCPLPPVSCLWSLPLRKCGLKYKINKISQYIGCHFPCGSVD